MALIAGGETRTFAIAGLLPRAAYAPETVDGIADVLRACDAKREAVVCFGGGTLQDIGNAPDRYDVALSLARLNGVVAYEPRDLTIAVEAGMTLAALDATLAEHRQFVPLDAPRGSASTVGGALASGWLGPRRATYGKPRDVVIGATIVLADGTIAKSGGMVVKNSTGYDLSRLYCGSFGTLGALARANFKTRPVPQTRRITLAPLPEGAARRAIDHVAALDLEPVAALAVAGFADEIDGRDGPEGRLFLLFEGLHAVVERATRELRSALGAAGVPETTIVDDGVDRTFARLLDAYVSMLGVRSATYRSAGVPGSVVARAEAVARTAQAHDLGLETILDIRTGDLITRVSARRASELSETVVPFDAALRAVVPEVRVVAAPDDVRPRLSAWGAPPAALETMRAFKARFDPHGTLAPGRFVGGI